MQLEALENGDVQLPGEGIGVLAEDVIDGAAVGTRGVRHVLHDAHYGNVEFLQHGGASARHLDGCQLRCCNDDCP